MPRERGEKVVARNKKALHEYNIGERVEAGLVLVGTEVKSLRNGKATLTDSYATIDGGEVWLRGANIPEYEMTTWHNHAAKRNRKLLLHKTQIAKLSRQLEGSGRTLVPLSIYFHDGYAKVELAVGTGKREWDKRATIAERDARRDAERELADHRKGR